MQGARRAGRRACCSFPPISNACPRQLSGGQRQRVAIGRAIVRDPKVFLFDEPLSNLDAALRVATRLEIAKLHRGMHGTTMVYVTHDQVEAMTLADRICVLRDGVVEQVGTPLELYETPHSMFVAGFIGSPKMNFLTGDLARLLRHHTIGVRAEHIEIAERDAGLDRHRHAFRDPRLGQLRLSRHRLGRTAHRSRDRRIEPPARPATRACRRSRSAFIASTNPDARSRGFLSHGRSLTSQPHKQIDRFRHSGSGPLFVPVTRSKKTRAYSHQSSGVKISMSRPTRSSGASIRRGMHNDHMPRR